MSVQMEADTEAGAGVSPLRTRKVTVVVGGSLEETIRREVEEGRRPRIDVLEMESRFGARIYDFQRLKDAGGSGLRGATANWLARKAKLWSPGLAYRALQDIGGDDVVYATGEDVGYPLAMLMRAFRVKRLGLVMRLDQPVLGRTLPRRLASEVYIQAALRRADWIGCHSNVQRQYLASVAGVPPGKLGLLLPKVDTRFFSTEAPVDQTAHEVVPNEPFIVSAGLEMRDYGTLIEAVRDLPVKLVIGAGSPWSHFRFGYGGPLPDNVTVGAYSPIQMRELYRSALFTVVPVRPTLRTCGVTVVLESWAMSKAAIVTRTVGHLDYASDGDDVKFVSPYSIEEMRAQIMRLIEDPAETGRLGKNGKARVDEQFNLDTYMEELERVLLAVLVQPGR